MDAKLPYYFTEHHSGQWLIVFRHDEEWILYQVLLFLVFRHRRNCSILDYRRAEREKVEWRHRA